MTLYELTNQESGIIVYNTESNSVAVLNWHSIGDNCMPILDLFGITMISSFWDEADDVFAGAKMQTVDDIRDMLPGSIWSTGEIDEEDGMLILDTDLDIVYDANMDLINLFMSEEPTSGTAYTLKDGRVIIAPDGWN